jgi:hypothetical protein
MLSTLKSFGLAWNNSASQLLALENPEQCVVLDLMDVTLVNEGAVKFLAGCESNSINLENCPA